MDHEMKVSSDVVRRLRNERGWSQEQLSVAAGLSLRTIQRVEGEGVASRETRVCLAATFDIDLGELSEDHAAAGAMETVAGPVVLVGYKRAPWVSALAVGLFAFCLMSPTTQPGGVTVAAAVIAIAAALYGGFGWYFQRSSARSTPNRRAAQRAFMALVIYCLFAPISGPGKAYLLLVVQLTLVGCLIYFVADRYIGGRAQSAR